MLFARQPISRFPLFPWSGYFFAGVAITALFRMSAQPRRWGKILVACSALLIAVIFLVPVGPLAYVPVPGWWLSSSSHALFRTSGVVLGFSLLYLLSDKLNQGLSLFLQRCGQESLYIYVTHLIVVYGSAINSGLNYLCSGKVGPLTVILFIPALTMPIYYTAMLWHDCKSKTPKLARHIMVGGVTLFLVAYAFMP
jgi:acyltransferase